MNEAATTQRTREPVKQFSVFVENKVGRLMSLEQLFSSEQVHILALMILDSTECSVVRLIVDDPDSARQQFREHGIGFTECDILVVELDAVTDLQRVLACLLMAEINLHYIYSFISRPRGKSAVAIHVEDDECAISVLHQNGFHVLDQGDLSR